MWFATEVFKKNPAVPGAENESVRIGSWGEDIAACFLKNHGWEIVGRRVRPCKRDRRCRKKNVLLRACANWLMWKKWHGNFRFDVIEVFGRRTSPRPPEIDHFENVPLFPPKWRFW